MSNLRKISYEDGWGVDAFGRLRVSQQRVLLEEKNVSVSPVLGNSVSGGASATRNAQRSSFSLTTGGAGSKATRQSRQRATYQPGESQLIQMTFVGYEPVANVTASVGYFDDNNGLGFRIKGTDLCFFIRSDVSGTPVDIEIPRSSWQDRLDGSGGSTNPSGKTLDVTKAQILDIDFQWLGVGRVRFGFTIDGITIPAYENLWSNIGTGVYMRNPNQPLRWQIEASDATVRTLEVICGKVSSEGGSGTRGISLSYNTGRTQRTAAGGNEVEVIAVRLNPSGTPPGTEAGILFLKSVAIFCDSSSDFIWRVRVNPVGPTGGTWTTPAASFAEQNIGRTGAVTGGVELFCGYGTRSTDAAVGEVEDLLGLGFDIFTGQADIFSLTVQRADGSVSEDYIGALNFRQEA